MNLRASKLSLLIFEWTLRVINQAKVMWFCWVQLLDKHTRNLFGCFVCDKQLV